MKLDHLFTNLKLVSERIKKKKHILVPPPVAHISKTGWRSPPKWRPGSLTASTPGQCWNLQRLGHDGGGDLISQGPHGLTGGAWGVRDRGKAESSQPQGPPQPSADQVPVVRSQVPGSLPSSQGRKTSWSATSSVNFQHVWTVNLVSATT